MRLGPLVVIRVHLLRRNRSIGTFLPLLRESKHQTRIVLEFLLFVRLLPEQLGRFCVGDLQRLLLAIQLDLGLLESGIRRLLLQDQPLNLRLILPASPTECFIGTVSLGSDRFLTLLQRLCLSLSCF